MTAPADLPPPPASLSAPYVYAATDIRPRQAKEIELCDAASTFDWEYTGAFALAYGAATYLDIGPMKQSDTLAVRLSGPALVGFTFGGLLSGAFLSLPKCDPLWAEGPPPEGNVRTIWPIATGIAIISGIMGPILDYTFLGPVSLQWAVAERSARVFIAAGAGVLGSLFPYLLPPRTWSARKQIDRMRVMGTPAGATVSYVVTF